MLAFRLVILPSTRSGDPAARSRAARAASAGVVEVRALLTQHGVRGNACAPPPAHRPRPPRRPRPASPPSARSTNRCVGVARTPRQLPASSKPRASGVAPMPVSARSPARNVVSDTSRSRLHRAARQATPRHVEGGGAAGYTASTSLRRVHRTRERAGQPPPVTPAACRRSIRGRASWSCSSSTGTVDRQARIHPRGRVGRRRVRPTVWYARRPAPPSRSSGRKLQRVERPVGPKPRGRRLMQRRERERERLLAVISLPRRHLRQPARSRRHGARPPQWWRRLA